MKLFNKKIDFYLKNAINDIIEIVKFKSILSDPEINAPFGTETNKALIYVLNLCKKFGFKVKFGYNNEYGYADYGDGKKIFGIICHLDVVPPGDLSKWINSPWKSIIKNNELFGRGVIDDKGPTIINIYALKYLKDSGFFPKKYKIRLIFGLTEETTWESINSYIKNEIKPFFSYTPDGQWPLVYAEKSIINFDIFYEKGLNNFKIKGGEAYNVVCDSTEIICDDNKKINRIEFFLKKRKINFIKKNKKLIILGKPAHASIPEKGINSIIDTAEIFYISKILNNNNKSIFDFIYDNFNSRTYKMENFFNNWNDFSGNVTMNIGKIIVNNNEQRICIDGRIPVSYSKNKIFNLLNKKIKKYQNLKIEIKNFENSVFFKKKSFFLQKMLKIYQKVTNDKKSQPLAIGGGTYARAFKNCIAFGACKNMDLMHNVNEKISINELKNMLKIYIKTISLLA